MRKDLSWDDAHRWHRRRGRRAYAAAAAILALGIAVSASFAVSASEARFQAAEQRFEALVERRPAYVEEAVGRYQNVLNVTRGFFAGTKKVTSEEFAAFTDSFDIETRLPALMSLQYIRLISGDPPTYLVQFVAPKTAEIGAIGNDLADDTSVKEALDAVGRGDAVAVAKPAPDPWNRPRMLMVTPVRQGGEFIGWLGASIDPARFGREILEDLPEGARGSIAWGDGDPVLATMGAEGERFDGLVAQEHVEAFGTGWQLTIEGTAAYAPEAATFPWGIFAAGVLPALFAAVVLFSLGRSRMQALLLAERLGRDLAASEARARAVTDNAVEAIITADDDGVIESANPATAALFGWDAEELVGRSVSTILPTISGGAEHLSDLNWGSKEQTLDAHKRDGTWVPVDVSLSPTSLDDRKIFILIARDATLRKLYEDQLHHQATHDALTGLANRKLFEELLMRAVFRGDRTHQPLAVLFVDLDGFKEVNDVFGHPVGDRVLAETARRLENVVRPGDVVARLGGDEFAVLCEGLTSPGDAEKIAGRIVAAVAEPIAVASGIAVVTASVGVALAGDGEAATSLVSRADHAMYEMKNAGKAGYRLAPTGTD